MAKRSRPDEWLTVQQAADESGYHPDTMRKLVRSGTLIGRKYGPLWQVSLKSLRAYSRKVKKLGAKRGPKPKA